MKKRQRYLTLIEVMIVIVLIGMIGGVIAYNMRGSLEEGRMFKTQQGGAQIYNILMLEAARGQLLEPLVNDWQRVVRESGFAAKPDQLLIDGWGKEYTVTFRDGDVLIESKQYTEAYKNKHGTTETPYLS